LSELIGSKHKAVGDDGADGAWNKSTPKASLAFRLVYLDCAVNDSPVKHIPSVFDELGLSCHL